MKENINKLINDLFVAKGEQIAEILDTIKNGMEKNLILKMIDDAVSTAKEVCAGNKEDCSVNVRNVGIALANVLIFDKNDARNVGVEKTIDLVNALEKCRVHFNQIAIQERNRLQDIIGELKAERENNAGTDNDIDEDLTKLSKEELIERLRRK